MSLPLVASIVLTVSVAVLLLHEAEASVMRPCTPCTQQECDRDPPQLCPWGEGRDPCGRRVCSKGPGERCGGLLKVLGECGEGMMCRSSDEKCHGCSLITLDCYN